jgi:hypothetical protein
LKSPLFDGVATPYLIFVNIRTPKVGEIVPRKRGGREMSQVLFRCPGTGKEFATGFRANAAEMKLMPLGAKINLRCKICGELHEFKFTSGRVDEDVTQIPASQR